MPAAHSPAAVRPALSLQPPNFAARNPGVGGWRQRRSLHDVQIIPSGSVLESAPIHTENA